MGIPDLLNFVSREFPQTVRRLPTPQELKLQQQRAAAAAANKTTNNIPASAAAQQQKPVYNYALVDMSNIVQTIGVQAAFILLTQQTVITHGIFLVADGNRQRAGARRERMMKMFRADKDVDMAMSQLSSQLKTHFEAQIQQQQETKTTTTTTADASPNKNNNNKSKAKRRGRNDAEDENAEDEKSSSSSSSSPVVIINIGSENYGEGDFKLLHLHRHLALAGANAQLQLQQLQNQQQKSTTTATANKQQQATAAPLTQETIFPPLFTATNVTTGRSDGQIGSPNPTQPSFLFVSEDSDVFCGALCGPCPKNVFLATTFHDLMTSLCVVSVGDCAEALAKKAGIDITSTEIMTPAERNRCIQFVALDVITLFTILLGNGQCPALAKGATRVDSRAVWTAYCQVRWPTTSNAQNQQQQYQEDDYYGGGGNDDDYYGYYDNDNNNNASSSAPAAASTTSKKNKTAVSTLTASSSDEEKFGNFLIEVQDPKKTHNGPSSSLVLNCELLAKVLAHFHCTDPLAHAPAAEQRKLAREYLITVGRSAFRYCAGTTIDTREEGQTQVPSLASLAYVADDSMLRFYPFTTTFALGMNNNTTAVALSASSGAATVTGNSTENNNKKQKHNNNNKDDSNNASATTPMTFTMNAIVPGLKTSTSSAPIPVSFTKAAVKSKEHKYTFGELTKMYTTIICKDDGANNNKNVSASTSTQQQQGKKKQPVNAAPVVSEKFSFELRRMIPVAAPTTSIVSNKNNGNKKNQKQQQQQVEDEFSYYDSEIMDDEERKQQQQKEVEKKKKKMSKKQKVKVAEHEADALQRKKDKNKKKNRKKKDKKAAAKAEKEAKKQQNASQQMQNRYNNNYNNY